MGKYSCLFPYEKVPAGSKIVIYGAGDVGQEYLHQMLITHYADVIGIVDRNYATLPPMVVPVYPPEYIDKFEFDYIVFAFKIENHFNDLMHRPFFSNVPLKKMVFSGIRNEANQLFLEKGKEPKIQENEFAFKKTKLSIALKYGVGLGDAIIKKRLFVEIARMVPEASFDIYGVNGTKFIPSFYSDRPELNLVIDDSGILYAQNKGKYCLSMSVFYMISVDHFDDMAMETINPSFANAMRQHIERHRKYNLNIFPGTQNWVHFGRASYCGWNCYSWYRYTNIFLIGDRQVNIPLNASFKKKYDGFALEKYATIHYGNADIRRGDKNVVSKQWPKEYFEAFAVMFKKRYPEIKLIQVGDWKTEQLESVDAYVMNEELDVVKYVLKDAIFHLDIEGGLMHLATQLGAKCVVIYGPTQVEFFGYPQNINIVSSKCNGCYCLYDNSYQCARGLEKPECMWSITPEVVMERIEEVVINDGKSRDIWHRKELS